eukprot:1182521-Amphidinium_carterae.1
MRNRPEQWPRVRTPAPALKPLIVETAESAVLPAVPFVIGPHQCVGEHETYAICLDCERHVGVHTGRECFNDHALKGRPCMFLKRKKKNAKLVAGFRPEDAVDAHMAVSGGADPRPASFEILPRGVAKKMN